MALNEEELEFWTGTSHLFSFLFILLIILHSYDCFLNCFAHSKKDNLLLYWRKYVMKDFSLSSNSIFPPSQNAPLLSNFPSDSKEDELSNFLDDLKSSNQQKRFKEDKEEMIETYKEVEGKDLEILEENKEQSKGKVRYSVLKMRSGENSEEEKQLFRYSGKGDLKMLRKLFEKNPNLDVNAKSKRAPKGWTGLHFGVEGGNEEVVEFLLEKGGKEEVDETGKTPLHKLATLSFPSTNPSLHSPHNPSSSIAYKLLERGFDANKKCESGETVLLLSCLNGNEALLKVLLQFHSKKESSVDLKAKGKRGNSCIHLASLSPSNLSIVKLLCEKEGVEWEAKNEFGENALHIAAKHGLHFFFQKTLFLVPLTFCRYKKRVCEDSIVPYGERNVFVR